MNWHDIGEFLSAPWWAGVQGVLAAFGLITVVIAVWQWVIEIHRVRAPKFCISTPQWTVGTDGTEVDLVRIENVGAVSAEVLSLHVGCARLVDELRDVIPNVLSPGQVVTLPIADITEDSWMAIAYVPHSDMRVLTFDWFALTETPPDEPPARPPRGRLMPRTRRPRRVEKPWRRPESFGRDGAQQRSLRRDSPTAGQQLSATYRELSATGGQVLLPGALAPATTATSGAEANPTTVAPPHAEPPRPDHLS
jgi:hypothetical protein